MYRNLLLGAILILAVTGGLIYKSNMQPASSKQASLNENQDDRGSTGPDSGPDTSVSIAKEVSPKPAESTGEIGVSRIKSFEIKGTDFKFDVEEFNVSEGDKVRINFTNSQGFHDWVLDEFNAKTSRLQEGKSETVEFIADKKGTFEYYCSVGSHRRMGMVGRLIVE